MVPRLLRHWRFVTDSLHPRLASLISAPGIIAPILATALVTHGVLFARFYFVMVGIRLISLVFGGWAFWSFERDASSSSTLLTELERTASRQAAADATNEPTKVQQLKIALKQRTTLVGALFIFAYQGAEVSNSGWVISFLINYRDGDPSKVGYATVGFWVSDCRASNKRMTISWIMPT